APRLPVGHEGDALDLPVGREQFPDVLLGDGEREIPKKHLHGRSLLGHCQQWQPQDCEAKRLPRPYASATRCLDAARSLDSTSAMQAGSLPSEIQLLRAEPKRAHSTGFSGKMSSH